MEHLNFMKRDEQSFNAVLSNRPRNSLQRQSVDLKATTHNENQQFLEVT